MNICVTGGAGYIGSVLTERLLNLGYKVTVVDTFLYGYHGIMRLAGHPLLTVVERDIRHQNRDYLERQDVVFHLAALSSIMRCERNRDWAQSVNRDATAEISQNLNRDTVLIFASSTAIYGDQKGALIAEDPTLILAHSVYSMTKLVAERMIDHRYNTIILRLATVYGLSPLMRTNSIVNDFVRTAIQDKALMLYDAETVRPYMHIRDCIDGLVFTMNHAEEMNGKCYNLGHNNLSKRGVADSIRRHTDFELFNSEVKDSYLQNFRADYSKIESLGFECKHSLFAGIIELIKLYSFYKP